MRRLWITAVLGTALLSGITAIGRATECPVSEFVGGNSADAFVPAGGSVNTTFTVTYHFTKRVTNPRGRIITSYGFHKTSGPSFSSSFWTSFVTRYTNLAGIFTSSSRIIIEIPVVLLNTGNPDDMLYRELFDSLVVECSALPALGWVGLTVLVALLGITGLLLIRQRSPEQLA